MAELFIKNIEINLEINKDYAIFKARSYLKLYY
jgi:hypothetical protein